MLIFYQAGFISFLVASLWIILLFFTFGLDSISLSVNVQHAYKGHTKFAEFKHEAYFKVFTFENKNSC